MHFLIDRGRARTLRELKTWFREYCATFTTDADDRQQSIRMKERHTLDVCAWIVRICRDMRLDGHELMLAETAALLHDVGRFEQCRSFGTFWDKNSFNHGQAGAVTVQQYGLLRNFSETEQTAILTAIRHHNAFSIHDGIHGEDLFFLRLVRDADKLDILKFFSHHYHRPVMERTRIVGLQLVTSSTCSNRILDDLRNRCITNREHVRTTTDHLLLKLSFLYDIQFDETLKILAGEEIVQRIAAALPDTPVIRQVVKDMRNDFLERKGIELFSADEGKKSRSAFSFPVPPLFRSLGTSSA